MAEERPAKILKTGKLRVGFICGKEDGDLVEAPGLPKAHHRRGEKSRQGAPLCPVSYTHLTLPTIYSV